MPFCKRRSSVDKIIIIVLATQGMFKLELSITTAYILPVKLRKSTHIGIFLFKD